MKQLTTTTTTASLIVLFALISIAQATPTHQFDRFFPGWDPRVQLLLRSLCKDDFDLYKTGHLNATDAQGALINPLIGCILQNFPEYRKQELSVSAVVLGLVPTLLQTIGNPTVELALVGLQSPLLGLLLSAASPAVCVARTEGITSSITAFLRGDADDDDDDEEQDEGDDNDRKGKNGWTFQHLIEVAEYLILIGAVYNVADLGWRLSVNAIAILAPNTDFGVLLWTYLAPVIHLAGVWAVWMRVQTVPAKQKPGGIGEQTVMWLSPTTFQSMQGFERRGWGTGFRSRVWYQMWIWIISIGCVIQTALGTIILSGLLFFSVADCLIILGRYIATTLVCRAVVSWEFSKMRAAMARRTKKQRAQRPQHVESTPLVVKANQGA